MSDEGSLVVRERKPTQFQASVPDTSGDGARSKPTDPLISTWLFGNPTPIGRYRHRTTTEKLIKAMNKSESTAFKGRKLSAPKIYRE